MLSTFLLALITLPSFTTSYPNSVVFVTDRHMPVRCVLHENTLNELYFTTCVRCSLKFSRSDFFHILFLLSFLLFSYHFITPPLFRIRFPFFFTLSVLPSFKTLFFLFFITFVPSSHFIVSPVFFPIPSTS